jgi:coenzyme F420-0:L-glutamate ligase/coenzyme F420-1:gamma-L-glutamate ligase
VGTELTLTAIAGIPAVQPGDDVADLVLRALDEARIVLVSGDVLVIAQKIISKAEDRLVQLDTVTPGERARQVARAVGKDPRLVELILQESDEISRMSPGVVIVRHRLGFTSANAGIDRSNVLQDGKDQTVLLLPNDPDASAMYVRQSIEKRCEVSIGVVISDSHGRPFRLGTVGVAIGVAGIPALWDRRGKADLHGYTLQHTDVGVGDEIAAAAGLLMGQGSEGLPVVLVRGLALPEMDGRATDLIRPKEKDLYR